jgi:hypothetical protein
LYVLALRQAGRAEFQWKKLVGIDIFILLPLSIGLLAKAIGDVFIIWGGIAVH